MAQDKAEKKRKRKRAAENGDHPSKKVVIDSPSQVVKVSILQDTGDWAPVIATTPGLSLSSIPAFKPYKKPLPPPTTRPSSTARSSISATSLLLHSSYHPKLDYTAREEDSHAAEPLLKHYIGVYNPTTSDLQVLEARNLVLRSSLRPTTAETPTPAVAESEPSQPNVDTYLLREDLRLENKEITQYFRELGCKVMPMSDTEIARLKLTKAEGKGRKVARLMLPLEFPKVRVRDSRRR
ncbi:RNA polymerase I associated factor, A49-like [Lasallia pustulata]|uniref:RNA polymerase I associated factor, A49-like n=1 Tax=Lasallia pustulata TaxID=136370 RepID=A0A1W5DE79_9LECA|nr:RNA polymerase I associated factor, A49-like [Lasallia pustulata]